MSRPVSIAIYDYKINSLTNAHCNLQKNSKVQKMDVAMYTFPTVNSSSCSYKILYVYMRNTSHPTFLLDKSALRNILLPFYFAIMTFFTIPAVSHDE